VRRHSLVVVHGGWRWRTAMGRSVRRRWLGISPELGDEGQGPCARGRGARLQPGLSGSLG
jgi:hypothetical protein